MFLAIVFSQFGPYHHARVSALMRIHKETYAIQIGGLSRTYAWTQGEANVEGLITLTDQAEEDASFCGVFLKSWKFWRKEKIQIAFLPSYFPATSLALLLSAKLAGVSCIMMNESHAGTERASGLKRRVKCFLLSLFDGALLGGGPHLRHFTSLGMNPKRLVTGYDAIDNDHFAIQAGNARDEAELNRNRLGLPERYILSLGRMVQKKNLSLLIESFRKLKNSREESVIKLVFVGSGECQDSLITQCAELKLRCTTDPLKDSDADVLFYGFRQIDENPIFYALADVFVLPSIYEEWGLVVNEAMACGVPVLVSNTVGSAEDLVAQGVNGFCFDPNSSDELAQHLLTLHDDPALRTKMGEASAEKIKDWGCENFAAKAMKIASIVRDYRNK